MASVTYDVVGREAEIAEIDAFLRNSDALPGVLLLEGEAGIGKTTLWRYGVAAASQTAYRVLSCSPAESEIQLSFTAAGDLLTEAAEEALAALPSPQRRALAAALLIEDASGPPPDQRAIALAFLGGLRALAAACPLVVAVDDVQWLDRSSALLLEFAVRRVREEPIGFLLARRARPGGRPPLSLDRVLSGRVQCLQIGPMTLGALHRLLRTRLRTALPRPLLRRVHEASGGNPFYALELGRTLKDRGAELDPGRPLPVPETLHEVVRERIEAQPPHVREALAAAAALSHPTVFAVGDASALDAAADAGLIQLDGERVRFTHPLLAAEAYASAGAEQRRRIHRRLADVSGEPEERARHLALATEEPSEEVAVALETAASRAARRGAPDAAAELSELAERLTPRKDRGLLDRQLQTIDYRIHAGAMAAARATLETLTTQLPRGRDRAAVLVRLAFVRDDDVNATLDLCRQALAESGGDDELNAEIQGLLAVCWLAFGDLGEARAAARSAVDCAERSREPGPLAAALAGLGLMDTLAGERPSAEFWERAVALERETDRILEHSPSESRGLQLMYADRLDEARTSLEEAYRRAAAHGADDALSSTELFLTELECRAGDLERALRHAESLYQMVGQTGREGTQGAALYAKAMVDAYLGSVDDARAEAEEGIALAEAANDTIFRIQNLAVLGFLELSLGDAAAADRHLRPLWPLLASMGYGEPSVYPVLPNAIETLIGIGELEEAVELLEQLEERGRALDSAWALSQAARCRGLLAAARGDPEGALAEFERALAEHERMPGPFERGRTLLAQGATLRRLKRRREARESLGRALAIFEEMGARLWADKARAELARIGGRAPSAGALTPTEQRVAELVAEGRANKEVARELFVTVKTVERNLSRVYEKLGVRSRAELARRYAREERANRPS